MDATVELSLLVWVSNEEQFLRKLHDGLLYEASKRAVPFEIVYIDDGSTDGTPAVLRKLKAEAADRVRLVTLRRPFGRAAALAAGMANAKGNVVAVLDATGAVPSTVWPRLVEDIHQGADFVVGRQPDRRQPLSHWAAVWLYTRVVSPAAGLPLHDMYSVAFAVRRDALAALLPVSARLYWFLPLLAHRLGYDVREALVAGNDFEGAARGWLAGWFAGLVDLLYVVHLASCLRRPLPVFAALAFLLALLAAVAGLSTLGHYLAYGAMAFGTLASLVVTAVLLGLSVQTLILGLAAEAATVAGVPEPYAVKSVE